MQKDLLAELHLPELDIKGLQNIITQNSTRLAYLIKENNDCLNKSKAIPLHFKEIVGSMVSDFTTIGYPTSPPKENIKTLKRKFILNKSLISSDNAFKIGANALCHPSTGNFTIPSKEESNTEEKNKSVESLQSSTNCLSNVGNSSKACLVTESSIGTESGPSKDDIGNKPIEKKTEVQLPFSKSSATSLLVSSGVSILKSKNNFSLHSENASESETVKEIIETSAPTNNSDKITEPAFCVISEVVGNATATFSGANSIEENAKEKPEVQLITPKKTNDITKIKGWRRKQFFVEKPTTIEFYSIGKGTLSLKKKVTSRDDENNEITSEDPRNVKNAFVCDSLDDFLDREAELKIGYEIPHLYAEFGIKLTRDEIVSKPNLSDDDIKEVETRYCVPVSLPCDIIDLDEIKEENFKGIKRPIGDDAKCSKVLKLDENKKHLVKFGQNSEDKIEGSFSEPKSSSDELERTHSNESVLKQSDKDLNKIKLVNKLIALVVYPGSSVPLHPIVQYHLDKIRSYRTKVDKNWASFAASAVLVNEKQYKRRILPAYCCVKIEKTNSVISNNKNDEVSAQKQVDCDSDTSKPEDHANTNNRKKKQIKLKKCSVILEKLGSTGTVLCMEHNRYNCTECGLGSAKYKNLSFRKTLKKAGIRNEDLGETVIVSPQASFDKKIASLLAKKVRLLKVNGDTLKSIDCLKTLTVNTVEFIKLKFVKESFLSGYLNVWYLKPEVPGVRFRAFLTFSHTPPVPNAINLKSSVFSLNNLPKVITEIVSKENTFDSNEYAILHCDGKIWEIHGSLNIAFGKCDKNVEQIFTSAELPELKSLQEIAQDILHVKAVKWWVLDLTQKFRLMELKSGNVSVIVTRKKFIETVKMNLFGFVPLRKTPEGRVLGALILQGLLPFVLIGPYYLLEANDLVLKGESSCVPFMYYGEENVTMKYPLKFFINSVLKNVGKCEKKLEGLWLYDKMCLDSTSYLEVVTSNLCVPPPNKYSSIDIEHGYSLNSLTNSSHSGTNSGILKRSKLEEIAETMFLKWVKREFFKGVLLGFEGIFYNMLASSHEFPEYFDLNNLLNHAENFRKAVSISNKSVKDGKEEFKKITVYLYFDIFELGFVEGELQLDNSVIISHPLDRRTKMKSHKIGDWFIGIIKRRIEFIPKDLVVRWFITKHKDDLRERRPFNKFFLGGAHILTRNGVFYLLEMSDSKMEELGIDKNEIVKAIAQSEVIREVKELKNLSNLLVNNPNKSLSMYEVLTKAVREIKKLRKLQKTLKKKKIQAEKEKLSLCSSLIKKLNQCRISFHLKMKIIEKLEPLFRDETGGLNENFRRTLRNSRIGRRYLKRIERSSARIKAQKKDCNKASPPEKNKINKLTPAAKPQLVFSPVKINTMERISPLKKSIPAILNVSRNTIGTKEPPKYSEFHIQIEKLSSVSNQFTSFKSIYPQILNNSTSIKESLEENGVKEKKSTEQVNKSPNDKFLKLTSPELPKNIKLCWENWNVNKLEVV